MLKIKDCFIPQSGESISLCTVILLRARWSWSCLHTSLPDHPQMEGIGHYDSDEDLSGNGEGEEVHSNGFIRKWLDEEEEDSDIDDDEGTQKVSMTNSGSSSSSSRSNINCGDKIASVDILFSSDTSKESNFLHTIAGKDEFKIPEYKQEERTAPKQQQKEDNVKVGERKSLSKAEELRLLDKQIEELKKSTGKGNPDAKSGKRDSDMNVKDKVKRQRLAGQTAISGGWKSEEEMRNRQLFDE